MCYGVWRVLCACRLDMRFSSFSFYSETYIQGKARGVGVGTPMKSIDAKCEPGRKRVAYTRGVSASE